MHRLLGVNPMLLSLALSAYREAMASRPAMVDPWCGLGLVALRAQDARKDRLPVHWMRSWTPQAVASFWESWAVLEQTDTKEARLLAGPSAHHDLARAVCEGVEVSGVFAGLETPTQVLAALKASSASGEHRRLLVGAHPVSHGHGVVASALEAMEAALTASNAQVWWQLPAEPVSWNEIGYRHLQTAHRLGVGLWVAPVCTGEAAGYLAGIDRLAQGLLRFPGWNQWVWPICDVLWFMFRDLSVHGKILHKPSLPGKSEAKTKFCDWGRVSRQIQESAELCLGGAGVLEEILVAAALVENHLLRRPAILPSEAC